ncbi:acetyl-CoA carboxylase biotin carboxyl carrier protein [Lederbergia citrea]|uniref:acetyl-CoA carboxylase biotin carboxyl carrier protein n=1 Tax=Lederbergia citrea TaxID=2833581 RepID=UPI001BCA3049|nr:acetyl-CoA carboxylase biotin carboxyl carrier protein [Lederbergia citrea]MBS4176383.1 acetyl-CoA carboxylase biotin carboxyl carrier protein [Lederbergia citrea]
MLKVQEIREIIKLINQSDIEEFVYEHEGSKIELKKRSAAQALPNPPVNPQVQPVLVQQAPIQPAVETPVSAPVKVEDSQPAIEATDHLYKITSPMVGTYYQSSSPDNPAYVEVGSEVKQDTVVCIVEAMKLFNEIEAEIEGEIVEVLVKNGQLVEYGQPLFLVKPR